MRKTPSIVLPPPRPATPDAFVAAGQPPEPVLEKVKPKRLTIDISLELHRQFKMAALKRGVDMKDAMTALIEEFVRKGV